MAHGKNRPLWRAAAGVMGGFGSHSSRPALAGTHKSWGAVPPTPRMQRLVDSGGRIGMLVIAGTCVFSTLLGLAGCGSDDSGGQAGGGAQTEAGTSGVTGGASAVTGGASAVTGGTSAVTGGAHGLGGAATNGSGGASATSGGAHSVAGAAMTGAGGSNAASGGAPAGGAAGGAAGMQPLGAICANDANCAQTGGVAVCCRSTCTLAAECSMTNYLPCEASADCAAYGGGKVCCEQTAGTQTMRFCTKQSACAGNVLP